VIAPVRIRGANRGAAVVLAMLLAALAAAIAATVFADQQRWSRNVEHRRDQVQAQALAMAAVQWARQILYDDARTTALDDLREPWSVALPPIPLENGEIRGAIDDAQGRLNLNALGAGGTAAGIERARIARLFALRGAPTKVLDAIADWIDTDSTPRADGIEDAAYLAQPVPYLPANAPLVRVAEIADVDGVTPQLLAALSPFVAALPAGTPTNVNTAPPEVLAAIVENLPADGLAAMVAARAQKPFASIADFRQRLPAGATLASDAALSVRSDHFYVSVEARQGTTVARARALLRRAPGEWPAVIWQIIE
jgi:general secretion pathway protein K